MRIRLQSIFLITAVVAVAVAVAANYLWPYQIKEPIPESILIKLDGRFDMLSPEMSKKQVFKMLEIDRYADYYFGNSKLRRTYRIGPQNSKSDYKLSFYKREDGAVEFGLKVPNREEWRDILFTNSAGWKK